MDENPQQVKLVEMPTGASTKDLPLTVGKHYDMLYRDGSCVCITTDDPNLTAHVWSNRVEIIKSGNPVT